MSGSKLVADPLDGASISAVIAPSKDDHVAESSSISRIVEADGNHPGALVGKDPGAVVGKDSGAIVGGEPADDGAVVSVEEDHAMVVRSRADAIEPITTRALTVFPAARNNVSMVGIVTSVLDSGHFILTDMSGSIFCSSNSPLAEKGAIVCISGDVIGLGCFLMFLVSTIKLVPIADIYFHHLLFQYLRIERAILDVPEIGPHFAQGLLSEDFLLILQDIIVQKMIDVRQVMRKEL